MKLNELLLKVAEGAYGDMDREVFVEIVSKVDGCVASRKRIPIQGVFMGSSIYKSVGRVVIDQASIDAAEVTPY